MFRSQDAKMILITAIKNQEKYGCYFQRRHVILMELAPRILLNDSEGNVSLNEQHKGAEFKEINCKS